MTGVRTGRVTTQIFVACLVIGGRLSAAQPSAPPPPAIPQADQVRLAEAVRLADALGDQLWPGWSRAPFAVLLVTPDREFLVRHPSPAPDFASAGTDPALGPVSSRPRQFDVGLLASFPAVGGISTIVIGQPANTAVKRSTAWVLTLLHEHFHQWQSSQPGYYDRVDALGLARGDQTGNWMLNYPFPYAVPAVQVAFAAMCARLNDVLAVPEGDTAATATGVAAYLEAKARLKGLVSADDYAYMNFQLWQEGISRYTEARVAELAAAGYAPGRAFAALPDVTRFDSEAQALRRRVGVQLGTVSLGEMQRTAFYAVGAGEGFLLDRVRPAWREQYLAAPLSLDGLLEGALTR
jgi:hypothetical protein